MAVVRMAGEVAGVTLAFGCHSLCSRFQDGNG